MLRRLLVTSFFLPAIDVAGVRAQPDPLPSWNKGPAKQAILNFVQETTAPGSPDFVPPEARLATFDQVGTLWVEHPVNTQVVFALDRVAELAPAHPRWKSEEPSRTVLSGDAAAAAKLSTHDLETIVFATHAGISVDAFARAARDWATTAKDRRWHRPYTALVYEPMLELMRYLRASGNRTYIVTGGGQDFVPDFNLVQLKDLLATAELLRRVLKSDEGKDDAVTALRAPGAAEEESTTCRTAA